MRAKTNQAQRGYPSALELAEIRGDSKQMGEQYGAIFASLIDGFYAQELSPDKEKLAYAARCIPFIKKYAPESYSFIVGMAQGAGLSVKDSTLLVLHEEIYHLRFNPSHCTGIVAPRGSTGNRVTYAAQNWDWQPQLFPWAGMLRMRKKGGGRILSYHYPGLTHCCGLNSRGLSLMWTGGGYFPPLKPRPGVPTYVLTSEVLYRSSVQEALAYLDDTPRAGAFMFLLADATGECAVVEATPDFMKVESCHRAEFRTNLYEFPETIRKSRQTKDISQLHSFQRMRAIKTFLGRHGARLNLAAIKDILEDRKVRVHKPLKSMTLDQIIAECENGRLLVKRGGARRDYPWVEYSV